MSEDGSISIDIFVDGGDGGRGETHMSVKPGHAAHTAILERFPNLKPGDDHWITIHSECRNGEWVDVPAPPPAIWDPADLL
jgi:hypothetical protein